MSRLDSAGFGGLRRSRSVAVRRGGVRLVGSSLGGPD